MSKDSGRALLFGGGVIILMLIFLVAISTSGTGQDASGAGTTPGTAVPLALPGATLGGAPPTPPLAPPAVATAAMPDAGSSGSPASDPTAYAATATAWYYEGGAMYATMDAGSPVLMTSIPPATASGAGSAGTATPTATATATPLPGTAAP